MEKIKENIIDDQSAQRSGDNVPKYMLHMNRQDAGVFFGTKNILWQEEKYFGLSQTDHTESYYVGKPQDSDGHVLVIGGAGSGKSTCIAMPTLESWAGTIFAIDIKGELTEYWNEKLAEKRPTKIINLTKEKGDYPGYDPFYFLRQSGDDDLVQNAREIAQAIIQIPPHTLEPFWLQAAQHVLTASLLYNYKCCNANFIKAIEDTQNTPLDILIKRIIEGDCDEARMHVMQFKKSCEIPDNKTLAGISAELSNNIMVFATDPRIKAAFTPAEDSVKWEDLTDHNIFMRIAEDKLGQWDGAITLMLTQLIRSLERRHDKKYNSGGKPLILSEQGEVISPTLLLLDEFPRLGKVDVIQNAVSTLRSKGVTICLMMQSLAQLDRTYGKETRQIVVDNCQYKAILQVTDPENQKIFSDMIGTIKVGMRGKSEVAGDSKSENEELTGRSAVDIATGNRSGDGRKKSVSTGTTTSDSQTVTESREPIVHPHELATLNDILLITPRGFCRVNKAPWYRLSKQYQQVKDLNRPRL